MQRFIVALLLGVALCAPNCSANLIVNGDFSQPGNGWAWSWHHGAAVNYNTTPTDGNGGVFTLNGWTVIGQSIDYVGPQYVVPVAPDAMSIDLDGTNEPLCDDQPSCNVNGGILQYFSSVPGTMYSVGFWYSANPDLPHSIKTFEFVTNGNVFGYGGGVAPFSVDAGLFSGTTNLWYYGYLTVTATSDSTLIEFRSTTNPTTGKGPIISQVDVELVPEPATFGVTAVGLFGLAMLVRKRMADRR